MGFPGRKVGDTCWGRYHRRAAARQIRVISGGSFCAAASLAAAAAAATAFGIFAGSDYEN